MRCPKCGYISFDYLSQCKKCGRDLSEVRQSLNLLDMQPAVPFLLGSLVGEGGGPEAPPAEISLSPETEMDLSGLDLSETATMSATMGMEGMEETVDLSALETEAAEAAPGEDLELSLEDLSLDQEAAPEPSVAEAAPPVEDEGFMGLELETEDESLEELGTLAAEAETELEQGLGEALQELELEEVEDAAAAAPEEEAAEAPAAEVDLDLTEDDLSALAKELEDQLGEGEEEGKPKDSDIDLELEETLLELDTDDD